MSNEAPKHIDPFDLARIVGDATFGTDSFRKELDPLTSEASALFYNSAFHAVALMAKARGVNFEHLSPEQQTAYVSTFLAFYSAALSGQPLERLERELPARLNLDVTELSVTANQIEVGVKKPAGEMETITFGRNRKVMLAYFTALTEAKIARFQNPWITRKELAEYTQPIGISISQLTSHLFNPLAAIGVLEINQKVGFRLQTSPKSVREMLTSLAQTRELEISVFHAWSKKDYPDRHLLSRHHIDFAVILYKHAEKKDPGEQISINEIQQQTGRSRDSIYDNLSALEREGLIHRQDSLYRFENLDLDSLTRISEAQEKPIVLRVKAPEPKVPEKRPPTTLRRKPARAEPLQMQAEEKFAEYEPSSWIENEVDLDPFDPFGKDAITQIDTVLTSVTAKTQIRDDNRKIIFDGSFPFTADIPHEEILGVLEFLGIGPKELPSLFKGLFDSSRATIAAALRNLEDSSVYRFEKIVTDEIKARLATFIFQDIMARGDVEGIKLKDLMQLLSDKTSMEKEVEKPIEEVVFQQPEIPNAKLLDVMNRIFKKEFASATSQETLPPESMTPVTAMEFHRKLSKAADIIPFRILYRFGLAVEKSRDQYHPGYTRVGALVAALYMNDRIRNAVLIGGRGEPQAIESLAIHVFHLLRERRDSLAETDLKTNAAEYIANCLDFLKKQQLACPCPQCETTQKLE